jgi:hypothetical protein
MVTIFIFQKLTLRGPDNNADNDHNAGLGMEMAMSPSNLSIVILLSLLSGSENTTDNTCRKGESIRPRVLRLSSAPSWGGLLSGATAAPGNHYSSPTGLTALAPQPSCSQRR